MRRIRRFLYAVQLTRRLLAETKRQAPNASRAERLSVVAYVLQKQEQEMNQRRLDREAVKQEHRT